MKQNDNFKIVFIFISEDIDSNSIIHWTYFCPNDSLLPNLGLIKDVPAFFDVGMLVDVESSIEKERMRKKNFHWLIRRSNTLSKANTCFL